jgi:hypothetical protein
MDPPAAAKSKRPSAAGAMNRRETELPNGRGPAEVGSTEQLSSILISSLFIIDWSCVGSSDPFAALERNPSI